MGAPCRMCRRRRLASLGGCEAVEKPEGMGGDPMIVSIMDQGKKLCAIVGETTCCTVIPGGFFCSRTDIQVRATRLPKQKNILKNELSSYQSKFSFFGWGVQNEIFLFLATWPKKRAPPKHYRNMGFSLLFFEKKICVTKRPFLDQKTQIQKFQLSFFLPTFFSLNNKNSSIC